MLNNKKYKISIDGLIFNSIHDNYNECTIFKWKPIITFDFKIKKIEIFNQNSVSELYCYNKRKYELFPFHKTTIVSYEIDKLYDDGDIIEFVFHNEYKLFQPKKIRNDKVYPNSMNTSLSNWRCLMNFNDINFY